jgi:hypothetical protein
MCTEELCGETARCRGVKLALKRGYFVGMVVVRDSGRVLGGMHFIEVGKTAFTAIVCEAACDHEEELERESKQRHCDRIVVEKRIVVERKLGRQVCTLI